MMNVKMILLAIFALLLCLGCAAADRLASPQTDGCRVTFTVSPDRPRANFDSEITVTAACPTPAGTDAPLTSAPTIKVFSEGDSDRQTLTAKATGAPGSFAAPVVFKFGGRYLVTFDSASNDKQVHRLFPILVEGFPDGGAR